jgi:hypothetical protein
LAGQPSPRNDGKSRTRGKKLEKRPASVNHKRSENAGIEEEIYIYKDGGEGTVLKTNKISYRQCFDGFPPPTDTRKG